ncbi:MAG TPA: hypothetical protein VM842_00870, partial [Nitrospira sp.]|nr:hypothetical protein [Nitrospira sp.]
MMDVRRALKLSIFPWLSATLLASFTPDPFATASIYTYVDDAGVQNFTNQFDSIPEKYRSRLKTSDIDLAPKASPTVPDVHPGSAPSLRTDRSAPSAEIRKVTAHGEYRLAEHDTRADGVRLAIEAAKKDALEQVATYLENVTEVRNMDVTRDDIRSYTAGIVRVLDEKTTTRLERNTIVIRADLTAEVDPHEVAQAIAALRENESALHELMTLRAETDRLQEQVDATNRALAAAPSPDEVQELSRQRDDMLNELQANALISQAWTSWTYPTVGYSYPWIAGPGINGLLFQAQRLYPRHRHLSLAQQTLTPQTFSAQAPQSVDSLPMRHSLLVPSAPHKHAHQAAPLLNPQGQPAKVGDVVVMPTPRSAPPAVRQSAPASPQTYQLHPSHFWRPTSPNIPNAPSVPGSSINSTPRSSTGSGHFSGSSQSGG